MLGGLTAYAEKANDAITITSTPPGATVEWNRKVIGVTPLTYTVGEYAFNGRKMTVFSKRLSQPVLLHVSLDGFISKDETITEPRIWSSLNGRNRFAFFVINFQHFDYRLDKVSAAPKVLTNADIIELCRVGFGDDLLIEKIGASATAFTLEVGDLLTLRKAGVSDNVMQTMIHKSTTP